MARFEHKLPAVLEPLGDICVQVNIPAHPDYIALFVRAIRMLETNRLYQRDEALSARIVVDQWRQRTITPLIQALAEGTGLCQDLDGECLAYPPFAGFISYSPQNPFTDPDLIPDGYEQPPFYVNGKDNAHNLPNYEKGDVIVDIGAISFDTGFGLENSPQIQLCLEGSGVLELKLLSIVQGGVVVVTVDNPPDILDIIAGVLNEDLLIVDTNQDIVSLPPETATEIIQEIEIPLEGEHIVYITFLPIIDDSLIPLRFGGGLRSVSLCGNLRPCGMPEQPPPPPLEGVTELRPEFQFTADCGMEYRLRDQENNIVQDWQTVPGWVENAAACFSGGGDMATVEEICDAVICALEKSATRFLQGSLAEPQNQLTIGPGGVINSTPEGQAPNDPTTTADEEARSGGALAIREGFQDMLKSLDSFFAQSMIDTVAQYYMESLYDIDDSAQLLLAIQQYFSYRTVPNAAYTIPSSLAEQAYCEGYSLGRLNAWAIANAGTLDDMFISLFSSVSDSQITEWYNNGKLLPSTAYLPYGCVPVPTEEFILNMSQDIALVQVTTSNQHKAGHRIRLTVSGTYSDPTLPNIIKDMFYSINTVTGAKTFTPPQFQRSGITVWSQADVPYREDHIYSVTRDIAKNSTALNTIIVGRDRTGGGGAFTNATVGELNCKIEDLGEF